MKSFVLKITALVAVALLLGSLLTACDAKVDESSSIYQNAVKITDAIIADDPETAYSVVKDAVTKEAFDAAYLEMREAIEHVESYTLTVSEWTKGIDNGKKYTRAYIFMDTADGDFLLQVQEISGYEGLVTYKIIPYTGHAANLKVSSPTLTVLSAVINLVELGFVVFAFVDCVRHCKRSKVLWAILIALGRITLSFVSGTELTSINVGLVLRLSSIQSMADGGFSMALVIPVAAIVWVFLRKKMCTPDPNVVPMPQDGIEHEISADEENKPLE